MTYKEFYENKDIQIQVVCYANNELVFETTTFSTDYLQDFVKPINTEIDRVLKEQWDKLNEKE